MAQARDTLTTLPNLLTLSRVAMVPALVAAFFLPEPATYWACLAIFVVAAATDFLDGWLARARDQITDFGRFLDPIADKILVAAALFMLVATDRLDGWAIIAGLIILCRELVVSGLREFLAGKQVSVPVTHLAKWKTTVQMVAIGFLLVGDGAPVDIPARAAGEALLWAAALLTLVTGAAYLKAGAAHMDRPGG